MPENDSSSEQPVPNVHEVLRELQEAQKGLSHVITVNKTAGVRPYYNEKFALELKGVLDEYAVDRIPREFRYDDFQVAQQTMRQRIYQSWQYLIEHLDPDGKYLSLRNNTFIRPVKSGLQLRPVPQAKLLVSKVTNEPNGPSDYKQRVHDFVTEAPIGSKLELKNLDLSFEEITALTTLLNTCDGVIHRITRDCIKMIKPNSEFLRKNEP